jgi:hypothetical protein
MPDGVAPSLIISNSEPCEHLSAIRDVLEKMTEEFIGFKRHCFPLMTFEVLVSIQASPHFGRSTLKDTQVSFLCI